MGPEPATVPGPFARGAACAGRLASITIGVDPDKTHDGTEGTDGTDGRDGVVRPGASASASESS
jgi:hypothetical protein